MECSIYYRVDVPFVRGYEAQDALEDIFSSKLDLLRKLEFTLLEETQHEFAMKQMLSCSTTLVYGQKLLLLERVNHYGLFQVCISPSIGSVPLTVLVEFDKLSPIASLNSSTTKALQVGLVLVLRRHWTLLTLVDNKANKHSLYLPMGSVVAVDDEGNILDGRIQGYSIGKKETLDLQHLKQVMSVSKNNLCHLSDEKNSCEQLFRWQLVTTAKGFERMPFQDGGNVPLFPEQLSQEGLDCSVLGFDSPGFVHMLWLKLGLVIPRSLRELYSSLNANDPNGGIPKSKDTLLPGRVRIEPGDLMFWRRDGELIHVSMLENSQSVIGVNQQEGFVKAKTLLEVCGMGASEVLSGWNSLFDARETEIKVLSCKKWLEQLM